MRVPQFRIEARMAKRKCRLFLVDTFTRERFCGNPAAVILDAEQLNENEMRRMARELHGTEVAFVLAADAPDHDLEIRFFSPRREVTFIGHAALAAHYVRAIAGGVPKGKVRQKSGNAIIEVEVTGKAPDLHVTLHQSPASFGPVVPEERSAPVLDALGISSASLHPACPMQVMSKWNSRLLIGLKSPEALESLQPDMRALMQLPPRVGADGFFVFALHPDTSPLTTESRMFCPVIGVPEDPVSGNAHAMLGVYLVHHGLLASNGHPARLIGRQGRFVDRPGLVDVQVEASGKRATAVQVAGDATIVYQAELEF
jgi:PhzF family phenazine biosynthesis protein